MKKGFTIIEVTAAIFIITVGTLGAFALIQRTLAFASITSSRLTATYLSQEGIEIVRNIRDTNFLKIHGGESISWDNGLTGCGAGCEADYNDSALSLYAARALKIDGGFYNHDSGTETKFKRKITITSGVDILEISVEVTWEEKGGTHQVTAQENLYNWW